MQTTEQDATAVQAMTPGQKLAVLESLIAQAWKLKEAWIRARHPDRAEQEVRAEARRLVGGPST